MLSHKVLTWSSWFSSKYLKSLETWNFSKFNFHCFHRSQISFHFNSMQLKITINPNLGEFLRSSFYGGVGRGRVVVMSKTCYGYTRLLKFGMYKHIWRFRKCILQQQDSFTFVKTTLLCKKSAYLSLEKRSLKAIVWELC